MMRLCEVIKKCRALVSGATGAIGILAAASAAHAVPATVTFDTFTGQHFFDINNPTATSEGYDFTSSMFHFHLGDSLPLQPSLNGILLQDIDNNVITMTKNGGGAFDLLSADHAGISTPQVYFQATGFFSGGGSITAAFPMIGNLQTAVFQGFLNLTSVEFVAVNPSAAVGVNVFWMDNVVVNTPPTITSPGTVPLPAGLALLGTAIAGLALAPKRRKPQSTTA